MKNIKHEAGHLLIAYLLGVLPKGYTITSLDTLIKQGSLNVQAGTAFVDFEFLQEVSFLITFTCFYCLQYFGKLWSSLKYCYSSSTHNNFYWLLSECWTLQYMTFWLSLLVYLSLFFILYCWYCTLNFPLSNTLILTYWVYQLFILVACNVLLPRPIFII